MNAIVTTSNVPASVVAFKFALSDSKVKVVEFNPKWANGTGYLNYAATGDEAPVLAKGEMQKSIDKNNRNILIIGFGEIGNFVMFERYSNTERNVIVFNCDYEVEEFLDLDLGGTLTAEEINQICKK